MSSPSSLRALMTALGREGQPVRLLLQHPGEPATSPYIQWQYIDDAVDMQAANGMNVWFEVQPSSYTALGGGRSEAKHIIALSALYADIDYKAVSLDRPGMGSEAGARDLIGDLTAALGLEPTAIVSSGHGLQPYWRLDDVVTNGDNVTPEKLAGLLTRWGLLVQHFATAREGNVDNVFDLPRVLRVPGPDNVKDPAHPEATSVEFSDHGQGFTYEEIDQILDDYDIPREHHVELNTPVVSAHSDWEFADAACSLSSVILHEIRASEPNARHQWALKEAALIFGLVRNGCVTKERYDELVEALTERMRWLTANVAPVRPLNDKELRDILQYGLATAQKWDAKKLSLELRGHDHAVDDMFETSWKQQPQGLPTPERDHQQVIPRIHGGQGEPPVPHRPAGPHSAELTVDGERIAPVTDMRTGLDVPAGEQTLVTGWGNTLVVQQMDPRRRDRLATMWHTDSGNAEHFAQALAGQFIHVPKLGWMHWDGGRFVEDEQNRVIEAAKTVLENLVVNSQQEAAQKWFRKSMSRAGINAALALTESMPTISVTAAELDSDGYVLVTPGGIVDLRTGTLRQADPMKDRVTKSTQFTPDWTAARTRFDEFIAWTMQGDMDMVAYLQRIFGAALIGRLRWHIFPIFLGPGANGKTTLLEIGVGCIGDYGLQMPRGFLAVSKGDRHPTDIARLRGVRLAASSEIAPNATFDEELVKQLAGEQKLTGRLMGENYVTFINQGTHILAANHLPEVEVGGSSFWRRVRKVDFDAIMPIDQQNPQLIDEILEEEGPAILAWMIDGAKEILETGSLRDPQKVVNATLAYQMEEDELFQFLNETVTVDTHDLTVGVGRDVLYTQFRNWAYSKSLSPMTAPKFQRELATRYPLALKGEESVYAGLSLKSMAMRYLDEDPEES